MMGARVRHPGSERWTLALLLAGMVAAAVLWAGVSGAAHLLVLGLDAMVPVALAAVGEVLNERGGLFNIGLEGIMLLASFVSVYVAELARAWPAGLLAGVACGAALAVLFALAATYGRANQLIAGVGLNLLALGVVAYSLVAVWGTPGFHQLASSDLRVPALSTGAVPLRWMVVVTVAAGFGVLFLLDQTRFGLRVRAAGYNPFVTDVSGVDVYRLRTWACTIGGALAGLGGAYMALDWLGLTARDLIQGRGFIALACVVFSGLDPVLAMEAAFLFSLFNAVGLWLQNLPQTAPIMLKGGSYLFLMLPYLAVVAVLWAFPRRATLSREIGLPYRRA